MELFDMWLFNMLIFRYDNFKYNVLNKCKCIFRVLMIVIFYYVFICIKSFVIKFVLFFNVLYLMKRCFLYR